MRAIADYTKKLASKKKEMSFMAEMGMCFFLWLMGKFPGLGKFNLYHREEFLLRPNAL